MSIFGAANEGITSKTSGIVFELQKHPGDFMWYVSCNMRFKAFKGLFSLFLAAFLGLVSNGHAFRCENLFESEVYSEKPWDLYSLQFNETQNLTTDQVSILNKKTLDDVNGTIPPANSHRAQSLPMDLAYDILDLAINHPVVGRQASENYQQPNAVLGFCFGRATYLHFLLLKMGVQKESIRKVWSVGPATTNMPNVIWGFHVALMVYTKEKGWVVLDTNESKPQTYEAWSKTQQQRSTDGKIRFYITEPQKFGINFGPYRRIDLGLTLPVEQDWYRHYFVDMLRKVRTEKLEQMGLPKLIAAETTVDLNKAYEPPRKPENFIEKLLDMFWVLN